MGDERVVMKKYVLCMIFVCVSGSNIQAESGLGTLIGMLVGALFGSAIERDLEQSSQQSSRSEQTGFYDAADLVCASCATHERLHNRIKKMPCNHLLCESCIAAKIDSANRYNAHAGNAVRGLTKNPTCVCGKTIDYSAHEQRKVYETYRPMPQPSAPPALHVRETQLCASGCSSKAQRFFHCGHGMCESCLRSRVRKAIRFAGNAAQVFCPFSCNDKTPCGCEIMPEIYVDLL